MPVYNEDKYLEGAIDSILNQTLEDIEFIIVDDGSKDGTKKIIRSYSNKKIKVIRNEENKGISDSRNRGIGEASGKYIACMDGDDISHPERLERQVNFLEENGHIGILGAKADFIDADGNFTGRWSIPTEPDLIAWRLLFNSCIIGPSVMMRRKLIEDLGGYEPWASQADDYELWTRAVQETRITTLPNTLYKLRRHSGSVTVSRREEQIRVVAKAAPQLHRSLLGSRTDERFSRFLVWMEIRGIDRALEETGVESFQAVHEYLRDLYRSYRRKGISKDPGIKPRRSALYKLGRLAERIGKKKNWVDGAYYKLSSKFMSPTTEFVPWLVKALSEKLVGRR
jgi:glycosyltransferase involved in cell wall biosynthesis